ncbi:MAG: cell division protein SepF [Oscillospiraceae bacterium]|jgi:cell division inhibitor SepF|nr:cell division protein SepF [Oscillospiraceae bacterium]
MAGIIDKFKDLMGIPPEDEEQEEMDGEEELDTDDEPLDTDFYSDSDISSKHNKVVKVHATTQLQVVIVKPEKFEDASSIADRLNDKHTVVLNLESCSKDVSRRLIDFLSGVAYANRGQIKKVANSTFIITPYHVDIMGDLMDELENSGIYF